MPNAAGTFDGSKRFNPDDTRLAGKLNRVQDGVTIARARSGVGTLTRVTTAGTNVSALNGRGRGSKSGAHPWQVKIKNFGTSDSPDWRFIVYKFSRLLEDIRHNAEVAVDGRAEQYKPNSEDGGWHPFTPSDGVRVWIELELNTSDDNWPDIASADVNWDGGGANSWDGGEVEYTDVGDDDGSKFVQIYLRILLAIIFDPTGDGKPVVDQWVKTHLRLYNSGGDAYNDSGGDPKPVPLLLSEPVG